MPGLLPLLRDGNHVREQLAVFESLDSAELTTVVRAAYETARMLARLPEIDHALSDQAIGERLRLAGIAISTR